MSPPDIAGIDRAGYCEDGRTFLLMLTLDDGSTVCVSACPGEPLRVQHDSAGVMRAAPQVEHRPADVIAAEAIARAQA